MTSGQLSDSLARKVTVEKKIPRVISAQADGNMTLIYVLGGNQKSLVTRFGKASDLYHQGVARKIHILSRPGITEFSPELGRNLTNDEWAVREIEMLKVKRGDIVPVFVDPIYFGTLSEAKSLTDMVRRKGFKRLILVSSMHHTRRAYDAFNSYISNSPIELYIYGAGDMAGIQDLLSEYIKLIFYNHILLPSNRLWEKSLEHQPSGMRGDGRRVLLDPTPNNVLILGGGRLIVKLIFYKASCNILNAKG